MRKIKLEMQSVGFGTYTHIILSFLKENSYLLYKGFSNLLNDQSRDPLIFSS